MNENDPPPTTPSGRLPKGERKKLKHPGLAPSDPRAGRVTLTTPLRDLQALDIVVDYLKNSDDSTPRVNRSTVIRALCRYARNQLNRDGADVATVSGKELYGSLRGLLGQIDEESYR
ncbi:MAG: hypothetical protein ABI600_12275 [Luteolibacter sp.]